MPAVAIRDWPLQPIRGITDDISRGQVSTMDNFKKIVRFLARYKLNTYSLYLEDMFVFKSHPLIGRGRGALTVREVKELDAYARRYHVELIPIFETLGHWENILAMPQYLRYAEFPGAHTLNVSDEDVYRMLDEMIGELAGAFSSRYFNIAADESWDVGLGVNKDRVAASDLATVHAGHYSRLFGILKKYHKRPMMYGDVILNNPAILDKIPKDVVVVDWHYGAADPYPSPAVFEKKGLPFVVSPAIWNFTGPFPNYTNAFINIRNFVRDGYLHGSRGVLTSNWNDYGGEELRELNYFGYAWTAECAWHPLDAERESFSDAFFRDFYGSSEAAEAARAVYLMLSDPLASVTWNELWRHPMLAPKPAPFPILWRLERFESIQPVVDRLAQRAAELSARNRDQWQCVKFVSQLNAWYAKKLRLGEWIRTSTQDTANHDLRTLADTVRQLSLDVLRDLAAVRETFERVWLTTNKPEGLDLLLRRYDRQASFWREKSEEVSRGQLWVDPLIESDWIYHPAANPGRRDSSLSQVPRAWFAKVVDGIGNVTRAPLQLIGDTFATLWVNGDSVGSVYARRSLSLIVEEQRIKVWDIARFLRPGRNFLVVEVSNFDPFGSAGFNLYAELNSAGEIHQTVKSDSTWRVTTAIQSGWQQGLGSDSSAVRAKPVSYPFQVIRPDLARGRSSWIER